MSSDEAFGWRITDDEYRRAAASGGMPEVEHLRAKRQRKSFREVDTPAETQYGSHQNERGRTTMTNPDELWDLEIDLEKIRRGLQMVSEDFQNIYWPEEARVRWHRKWKQVSQALELTDSLIQETIDEVNEAGS